MRLIEVKKNLNIVADYFKHGYIYPFTTVQELDKLKIMLTKLVKIGFFPEHEEPFWSIIHLPLDTDPYSPIVKYSIGNIDSKLDNLRNTVLILNEWLNKYLPDVEDESTINIKLPPLNTVDDLTNSSILINKALTQSVSEVGGELKIKHLDYGSSWIIICAGTAVAAKLILALANAAFEIAKKYIKMKEMQKVYEIHSKDIELLNKIIETNDAIIAYDTKILAQHIEKDFYPDSDNERIERLKWSIGELSKLLSLGGEVHPPLSAPSPIQSLTPNYKELVKIVKEMAELPKKTFDSQELNHNINN